MLLIRDSLILFFRKYHRLGINVYSYSRYSIEKSICRKLVFYNYVLIDRSQTIWKLVICTENQFEQAICQPKELDELIPLRSKSVHETILDGEPSGETKLIFGVKNSNIK